MLKKIWQEIKDFFYGLFHRGWFSLDSEGLVKIRKFLEKYLSKDLCEYAMDYIKQVDTDNDGWISGSELLKFIKKLKGEK